MLPLTAVLHLFLGDWAEVAPGLLTATPRSAEMVSAMAILSNRTRPMNRETLARRRNEQVSLPPKESKATQEGNTSCSACHHQSAGSD